jgi:hypothetical protein
MRTRLRATFYRVRDARAPLRVDARLAITVRFTMAGGTGEQTRGGQEMSGPDNMTNRMSGFDQAVKRVMDALDTLDAVLEQRFGSARNGGAPGEQIQVFNIDRSRLASELDAVRARARELENSNREAVRRIDAAMSAIRAVIAANRN